MIGEADIDGVFVPRALIAALIAFAITHVIRWLLRRVRAYPFIWHAGLFDTSLFFVVFFLVAVLTVPHTDGGS